MEYMVLVKKVCVIFRLIHAFSIIRNRLSYKPYLLIMLYDWLLLSPIFKMYTPDINPEISIF